MVRRDFGQEGFWSGRHLIRRDFGLEGFWHEGFLRRNFGSRDFGGGILVGGKREYYC